MAQIKKLTRKEKADGGQQLMKTEKVFNDKFGIEDWILNEEQKQLSDLIDTHDIVFVSAKAGCGKSGAILHNFTTNYLWDKYKEIYIVRTPVEVGGDKIGFLVGSESEKKIIHFQSTKDILNNLLNKEKVACDIDKRIHFKIPNYMLGCTIDNGLMYINEAQQIQPMIMKLLLERIGTDTTCVIDGDETQLYTTDRKRNGLTHAIDTFFNRDEAGNVTTLKNPTWEGKIAYFKFSNRFNMRSDIVKIVNEAYENMGVI